jgi:hypothetical protein
VRDYENTGLSNTILPLSEIEECVACAAGLQPRYIISMGGVRKLETGESITAVWNASVESVTRTDMRSCE